MQKTPAKIHVVSARAFPDSLRSPEYGDRFFVRKI